MNYLMHGFSAINESGEVMFFDCEPFLNEAVGEWWATDGRVWSIKFDEVVAKGTRDWRETLIRVSVKFLLDT